MLSITPYIVVGSISAVLDKKSEILPWGKESLQTVAWEVDVSQLEGPFWNREFWVLFYLTKIKTFSLSCSKEGTRGNRESAGHGVLWYGSHHGIFVTLPLSVLFPNLWNSSSNPWLKDWLGSLVERTIPGLSVHDYFKVLDTGPHSVIIWYS